MVQIKRKLNELRKRIEEVAAVLEYRKNMRIFFEWFIATKPSPTLTIQTLVQYNLVQEGDKTFTSIPYDKDWRDNIAAWVRERL